MRIQEPDESSLTFIRQLAAKLPSFPDGRIDYTKSDVAPVVNCIVYYDGRVLLLQRSSKVGDYQGAWSGVDGYVDRTTPISQIVLTELREELSINEDDIARIAVADSYESYDDEVKKTWIVFAVLVELNQKAKIILDWEHSRCKWIEPNELQNFDFLPNQDKVLRIALGLR
jgi:8-oxo-dGTP pyrophosphatase MutT (NUDIX family)